MNAVGQAHGPATLALIHLQNNGGLARSMFGRIFDDQKIGTHVCDADGFAVDYQLHLDMGRMRSVALIRNHKWNIGASAPRAEFWEPVRASQERRSQDV